MMFHTKKKSSNNYPVILSETRIKIFYVFFFLRLQYNDIEDDTKLTSIGIAPHTSLIITIEPMEDYQLNSALPRQ